MDARIALGKGNVTPALRWVQEAQEPEFRSAFKRTMAARAQGRAAREVADLYFFETLVRVHRAGEGAPYTGLKPAGSEIDPGILAADHALETGSVDAVVTSTEQSRVRGGLRCLHSLRGAVTAGRRGKSAGARSA